MKQYLSLPLPLIVSETGVESDTSSSNYENTSDFFSLVNFCNTNNIPYAGWTFGESCHPSMLVDQDYNCGDGTDLSELTPWGELFLNGYSCDDGYCGQYY